MVILGADVVHLVDAAALGAALKRALLGKLADKGVNMAKLIIRYRQQRGITYAEPGDDVRVGRVAGATDVLLLTSGADRDGAVHRSLAAGIEGTHVEDVDTLHLSENFETLETGGLLKIGRDGAGLGTRAEEIVLTLDFCSIEKT